MHSTDYTLAAAAIADQIDRSNRILLLSHLNPDGDAIGSLLAVYHMLRSRRKRVIPLASPPLPHYCTWLPGIDAIQLYQPGQAFPDVDLIILVDVASMA